MLNSGNAATGSPIGIRELEDRYLTKYILAAQKDPGSVCESISEKTLSRVEDYLVAHLSEPVSRSNLAEIAGVSIRSLSRGFVKRHGVGPMGFLKQHRLEAAYRELEGADKDNTTVTDVAMKFGFNHLGKFAIGYREAFGEVPSRTLAR